MVLYWFACMCGVSVGKLVQYKLHACVQWNGVLSDVFKVTCGLRRGNIISPFLIAFINKLIMQLISPNLVIVLIQLKLGAFLCRRYSAHLLLSTPVDGLK
jgi:hypothetical protein